MKLLEQDAPEILPRPFWEQILAGPAYASFLRALHGRSMLNYTMEPVEMAGVFRAQKEFAYAVNT